MGHSLRKHMSRRCLTYSLLLLAACVPPSEPATSDAERPPCDEAVIASFDPGVPVRGRSELPPMTQTLQAQTAHVATVRCGDDESDSDCLARAENETVAHYPSRSALHSELIYERHVLLARMLVDGVPREQRFDSLADLGAHVEALQADGSQVQITGGDTEPAQDAARSAVVRAEAPQRASRQMTLRMRLTLEAPSDPVAAMLTLQERAAAANFAIQTFRQQDDGAIVVDIGCRRLR